MALFACVCALLSGCGGGREAAGTGRAAQGAVVDSAGRTVPVPLPLTRVVVANGYNVELINAVGALDAVAGVDYGIYQDQAAYKGRFRADQVIGKSQRELNYEKIVALAPQALILTGNGAWAEAEKKLAPFGIQVLVVDAYDTERFAENCALLGTLFGQEARARELAAFFAEKLAYVARQLQGVEKKTVYFEYRRAGNTTVPGDYFYRMVECAGGKNVFADARSVSVGEETVVLRNPAYIVKVGQANVSASYAPPTREAFAARKRELCGRPGWDAIDAVRNDRILLLSHFCHGGASKLVGALYIAKYLYPERLPKLQPEAVFREWLVKYQGLEYVAGHTYPAFQLNE